MDAAILNRIRNILTVYRDTWQGPTNKPFGWGDLAGMVEEHYFEKTGIDIDFPKNSLENFVRGLPHTNRDKRKAGMRKYSKPEPDRIDALLRFLTDKDSDGYFCTLDELLSLPEKQAPVFLLNYLHDSESPDHYLSFNSLYGNFANLASDSDGGYETRTSLHFLCTTSNSLILIDIYKSSMSEKLSDECYIGWGVITPEENLFLVVKHLKKNQNLHYLSLGIDKAFYRPEPPNAIDAMVFLEHSYPEDTVECSSSVDGKVLLDEVMIKWEQQVRLFEREQSATSELTSEHDVTTNK